MEFIMSLNHYFTSLGKNIEFHDDMEKKSHLALLWISFATFVGLIPLTIFNIFHDNISQAFICTIFLAVFASFIFFIKRQMKAKDIFTFANLAFLLFIVFSVSSTYTASEKMLFSFIYPVFAVLLFGARKGFYWSIFLYIICIVDMVVFGIYADLSSFIFKYTFAYFITAISSSLLGYFLNYYHEKTSNLNFSIQQKQSLLDAQISKNQELQAEIYSTIKPSTDSLTNLLNTSHFMLQGEKEIQRAKRYNYPVCLAILGVDKFKKINELCGLPKGDEVLRVISRHCTYVLRESDLLSRLGAGEFAFLLLHANSKDVHAKLEKLRKDVEKLNLSMLKDKVNLTVSIGVCEINKDVLNIEDIYQNANEALNNARKSENCVKIFKR